MPGTEDRRLVRLTKICLALPEVSRELTGDHAGFKVRKTTFGYFLNNHHGDGIVAVCFKSLFPRDQLYVETGVHLGRLDRGLGKRLEEGGQ